MELQTITEKIEQRRRQILVHSCLYYQMDSNVISDSTYDAWSKELAELQRDYPAESKEGVYYKDFEDFDGSSGFDLPFSLPEVQRVATWLLENKRRNNDGKR